MLRRLRIAASVFFALVTVALCLLWVRSHWMGGSMHLRMDRNSFGVETAAGILAVGFEQRDTYKWRLDHHQYQIDDVVRKRIATLTTYGFGYVIDSNSQAIIVPFWLPALSSFSFVWIVLGKLPNRHSFRFSLRTMLIVTTLIAVVLGLVCYTVR